MKMYPNSPSVLNISRLINCRGKLLDLSTPRVMGILNVTPDSFYDGGKFTESKAIIKQVGKMLINGASIIDVGAQSTRPGAKIISEKTEKSRLIPAIDAIMNKFPEAILSVDTFRASVVIAAIEKGASIINDVSGGNFDKEMFKTAGKLNVPYILMHMQGSPETMQKDPKYKDVVSEVTAFFLNKIAKLKKAGVTDIIIDPGFGFGKTVEHNYKLLNNIRTLEMTGHPVLAGISRKSMICKVLKVNPDKALNGTTALNMAALINGASILRVHDVKEAVEVVRLYDALKSHQ
ncbi:MAG TPA: dihydropteroate synthase [Bacteroidia bacterium]|nr:dihydropteroate synthase [Bacteroidia bacterium]